MTTPLTREQALERYANEADLHWANLRWADLRGADLRGANLRGANLHEADLRGANLHEANLHRADLRGANLRGANLHEANLHEANLHEANLHRARGLRHHAACPSPTGHHWLAVEVGGEWVVFGGCRRLTVAEARARYADDERPGVAVWVSRFLDQLDDEEDSE